MTFQESYWFLVIVALLIITSRQFGGTKNLVGSVLLALLWPVSALVLLYYLVRVRVFDKQCSFELQDPEFPLVFLAACILVAAALLGVR